MIAVDTSALMAILLDEPEAGNCAAALAANHPVLISAAPVAEALIVGEGRYTRTRMGALIDGLGSIWQSATNSPYPRSSSHKRRATNASWKYPICATGPPNHVSRWARKARKSRPGFTRAGLAKGVRRDGARGGLTTGVAASPAERETTGGGGAGRALGCRPGR